MMTVPRILLACLPMASRACSVGPPGTPAYTLGREAVRAMSKAAEAQLSPTERLFMSVPSNDSARTSLKYITARPHVAGTSGDLEMAHYVQRRLLEAGLPAATIDPQLSLLAYPVNRSLEVVDAAGRTVVRPALAEDVLSSDSTSDTWWRNHTFNGYSPSGEATGPIVYVNYGMPEDFAALERAGVSAKGAVALMRYGKCFRGLKARNAQQAGAVAALIYSDPADDGFAVGAVYPDGPWRPASSVQRGSIQFISTCAGDPSRAYAPHGKTVEEVCGYSQEEIIPQIPVLPLSYGDAWPLLQSLGGPVAPAGWQGALNLTYRLGPSADGQKAILRIQNHFQKSPVWNVIAKIPGTLPSELDQPVILGNHRDAWVFGAADPNSGTAALIEVARGLGQLLRSGWRPLRSIILCSWSGEEYGLVGSTAWAEVHGDGPATGGATTPLGRALAYLNVDIGVSGPVFGAAGTPSLGQLLASVLGQVTDPSTQAPLSERWDDGDLFALGSGSDYTAFIDHLGIPSLDMSFIANSTAAGGRYGVYHSIYDSFTWMETEGDPGFQFHVAMSQVWGLLTLRLALSETSPAPLVPLNASMQAEAIKGYATDIREQVRKGGGPPLDFAALAAAAEDFAAAAAEVHAEAAADGLTWPVSDRLALVERQFLVEEGLPKRKWFRHCLQAPGLHTGYAAKTLPGIDDALLAQDWDRAAQQAKVAAERISAAAEFLRGTAPSAPSRRSSKSDLVLVA